MNTHADASRAVAANCGARPPSEAVIATAFCLQPTHKGLDTFEVAAPVGSYSK